MFICHLVIALSGYVIDKFCEACLKQSQPLHESCLNINQVHGNESSYRTQLSSPNAFKLSEHKERDKKSEHIPYPMLYGSSRKNILAKC